VAVDAPKGEVLDVDRAEESYPMSTLVVPLGEVSVARPRKLLYVMLAVRLPTVIEFGAAK
jgi:hypothetical protein